MPEATRVNVQDASPKRLLINWANTQDAWLRAIVAEIILTRKQLPDSEIERIYGIFLAEKAISDAEQPDVPMLELAESEETLDEQLAIVSVDEVRGVNALAEGGVIEFDPGLTILFGQNASGKTGYARIIKRAAAVRTVEPVLPNAYASGFQPDPSARIKYKLDGKSAEITWNNEAGVPPFTRIGVFDSASVNIHLDNELGYVYTPAELALFSNTAEDIKRLQGQIMKQVSELRPGSNPLLSQFLRGTTVYPVIEGLGSTTDLSELDELVADIDEHSEERRARLQEEVNALRGGALDALLATAKQRNADLQRLQKLLQPLTRFNAEAYNAAVDGLQRAETERRRAREELFRPNELPGPPDDDWQRFVAAGEAYRSHLNLHPYPQQGDACLYCRQPLSSTALELVQRYRRFLDESLVRQVSDARVAAEQRALSVGTNEVEPVSEYLTALADQDQPPSWLIDARGLVSDIVRVSAITGSLDVCQVTDLSSRALRLSGVINAEIEQSQKAVADLTEQKDNRVTSLAVKQKELAELTARITLSRNIETARSYVRNAKQADRLERLSRRISSNELRQLTEQSKLASEDLVNKSFEQLFAEECDALRTPKVVLEFQGRSGRAERRKVVARHRPSEVLSEGEQKVLALADFLAESRMRGTKAPIIFDDPVTSLDYIRLEEVSARIIKLADSHQVVVFTHNIMFASQLIAQRQSKKLRCKFYEVRGDNNVKGIVCPDVEPRLDTPTQIGGRISETIQRAKSADPALQDALVERGYGLLRSWCEAFVEQELLQNVTQRYRANVMMGKLDQIKLDRFPDASRIANEIFDKSCRYMTGHSQPGEQLNVRASVQELEGDWAKAQQARSNYVK